MSTLTCVLALAIICICIGLLYVYRHNDASNELEYTVKGKIYKYYNVPPTILKLQPVIRSNTHLRDEMVELLHVFSEACAKCKVQWWLDWGSCLGWLRNGAIIPWDDDLDISMRKEDEKRLLSDVGPAILGINPRMTLVWCDKRMIKIAKRPKCFPWIDLEFHSRENGDVWIANLTKMKNRELVEGEVKKWFWKNPIPNDILFPLRPATLHGVDVYVPQDPKGFMEKRYGKHCTRILKCTHLHGNHRICEVSSCKKVL